jgi:ribosomal protein S21
MTHHPSRQSPNIKGISQPTTANHLYLSFVEGKAVMLLRLLFSTKSVFRKDFTFRNPPRFNPGHVASESTPTTTPAASTQHTYRENLYSARRITLANPFSHSPAIPRLKRLLHDEGIVARLNERKRFVKPSVRKGLKKYKVRKEKFDVLVKEHINRALELHECTKQ